MKVIITDYEDTLNRDLDYEIDILKKHLPDTDVEIVVYEKHDQWLEAVKDADGLLTAFVKIGAEEMDAMPNLKCIALNASGYDTVDVEAASKRNIGVCPIYSYCTDEVADHTMALILALERGLKHYTCDIDDNKCWNYTTLDNVRRINGQILGICGLGKIGKAVAKRAQVFGMRVIAYSAHCSEEIADSLGIKLVDKKTLFQKSHVISNHMAQSHSNYHFFDDEAFNLMEQHPFFINVGRGSAVDEKALEKALDNNILSGAGIDVLADENPNLEKCGLTERKNVIITPHAAFYSIESLKDLQTISCMNLVYYLNEEYDKVTYIVNNCRIQND